MVICCGVTIKYKDKYDFNISMFSRVIEGHIYIKHTCTLLNNICKLYIHQ